jgi:pimeloyl-ACP methyl ester carboxylesterase
MTQYCEFREGKLRYRQKGQGRVVIFLHGFLESLEIWDDLSEELSKSYRVISIDLPGHGKSEQFGYVHSMELMADAVMAVLKKERLRKVVLVGHSMGGYAALAFSEKYPEYLRGLCLFHSFALADNAQKKSDRLRAIDALKRYPKKFIRELIKNLFSSQNVKILKEEIKTLEDAAIKGSVAGYCACILGMRERINREVVLKFAPFRVLMLAGKDDKVIPEKVAYEHSLLPEKSSFVLLENSAHMGFLEEPGKVLRTLRSFVNQSFRS